MTFVLKDKNILSRSTFLEAVNLLASGKFVRVHRSYMVAVNKIDKVERHQVTVGKAKIPVSEGYVQDVMNAVGK